MRATSKVRAVLRHAVLDQADLCRGAAHVVGHHLVEAETAGDVGREDGAAGGTGLDQADGKFRRGFDRDQPAARMDHEDRAFSAHIAEPLLQAGEIVRHLRAYIGIGANRVEALEFAHLRRHFGADRDRDMQPPRQDLPGPALMRRIGISVDEADRDGAETAGANGVADPFERVLIERLKLRPSALIRPFTLKRCSRGSAAKAA